MWEMWKLEQDREVGGGGGGKDGNLLCVIKRAREPV